MNGLLILISGEREITARKVRHVCQYNTVAWDQGLEILAPVLVFETTHVLDTQGLGARIY